MLLPYFIGVVTAPLVGMIVKPLVRGTVKTTIGVGLQVKKLAAEAAEDMQDLAAEASAEFVQSEADTQTEVVATPRPGTRTGVTTVTTHKKN